MFVVSLSSAPGTISHNVRCSHAVLRHQYLLNEARHGASSLSCDSFAFNLPFQMREPACLTPPGAGRQACLPYTAGRGQAGVLAMALCEVRGPQSLDYVLIWYQFVVNK